ITLFRLSAFGQLAPDSHLRRVTELMPTKWANSPCERLTRPYNIINLFPKVVGITSLFILLLIESVFILAERSMVIVDPLAAQGTSSLTLSQYPLLDYIL